jgi:hypothetical protein
VAHESIIELPRRFDPNIRQMTWATKSTRNRAQATRPISVGLRSPVRKIIDTEIHCDRLRAVQKSFGCLCRRGKLIYLGGHCVVMEQIRQI